MEDLIFHMQPNSRAHRLRWIITLLIVAFLFPGLLGAATTWDGSTDTDWTDSTNWSAGVPDSSDDVTIPTGLSNYPMLAANADCSDLTLDSGATLNLASMGAHDKYAPMRPEPLSSIQAV